MPTPAEKLERLESLLERIRTRARLPADDPRAHQTIADDAHPLRGTDPGIAAARLASPRRLEISAHATDPQMGIARPAHARLELPMPAPIPVSDVAPTNPLPARRPEARAPEPPPAPQPTSRPASSAPPRGPLATPLPPAMPGLFIPPTKSLLMGRPRLDSTPPPPQVEPERAPIAASHDDDDDALGLEPNALAQAPIEEAPVAAHRVVRVASRPPETPPQVAAPAPLPRAEGPIAPVIGGAPPSSATPVVPGPVVPLPPSMRAEAAPASAARALAIEAKRGRGGWWVASFVFLLFVAALIVLRHFGLLPTAPP